MHLPFRSVLWSTTALALLVTLAAPAEAQAPLVSGFGGPAGFGSNSHPANDDDSSSAIDLTSAFPGGLNFFGGPYEQVFVNNNGNLTFSSGLRS